MFVIGVFLWIFWDFYREKEIIRVMVDLIFLFNNLGIIVIILNKKLKFCKIVVF